MKQNYSLLKLLIGIAMLTGLLSSCHDDPSPEEEQLKRLTATWMVNTVSNDNTDVTSQFDSFTLTVSGDRTYSTTNGGNPWPASGTFTLTGQDFDSFRRDDGVIINLVEITDSKLILSFQMNSVRSIRSGVDGITGDFTFNLTKIN